MRWTLTLILCERETWGIRLQTFISCNSGLMVTSLERKLHLHQALQRATLKLEALARRSTSTGVSTNKNRNYAVLAGTIAGLRALGWYLLSEEPKKTEEVVDRIGPANEGLPISLNMLFAAVHGLASQLG